jgi:anti-sigma B factor antagonist
MLNLKSHASGDVTVLELSGHFDSLSAPPVAQWLERAAATNAPNVVVNLTAVEYIDSTGLATLLTGKQRCKANQGDVRLCHLQDKVREVFEVTRLVLAFRIFPDETGAVTSFGK